MIDDLKKIIEQYKDFVECETETARVWRNVGNENNARDYEETAENDKRIVDLLTELQERRETMEYIKNHYVLVQKFPRDNPNELIIRKAFGESEDK